jgi:hypothetical protein
MGRGRRAVHDSDDRVLGAHQAGEPALARDYAAPEIQQAAMPIRIERRRSPWGVCYRVVDIVCGGAEPA